jgi:hypothetical protein
MIINSVSVPSIILSGSSFSIDVSVSASPDDFEDGSAYRLFVFVTTTNGLLMPPIQLKGHLQDAPWTTQDYVFSLPVSAGSSVDIYNVTAILIEGPSGIDPDGTPSVSTAGPILVIP